MKLAPEQIQALVFITAPLLGVFVFAIIVNFIINRLKKHERV